MKFIITSTGDNLKSKFDLRFGRAGWFCLYDSETKTAKFIENNNKDARGGAGTKAVEKIMELGVMRVISGDFGPKAKTLLERLKIQMVMFAESNKSVQDIIDKVKS
ncbi:MAG: dinitrogenase iron-molybdenum cofactor biosynthesis protein [Draconibacterium sp.]|nr:dinitrogenase iron-molybdenum cofactor biosynthesis protein [Draconibacterium sp.]